MTNNAMMKIRKICKKGLTKQIKIVIITLALIQMGH